MMKRKENLTPDDEHASKKKNFPVRGKHPRLRRFLKYLCAGTALLILSLPVLYLFRWQLFGNIIRVRVERAAGKALKGSVRIGSMSGSIIGGIEFRNISAKPLADSFLLEPAFVEHITARYSLWGLMTKDGIPLDSVEVRGLRCAVKEPEPSDPDEPDLSIEDVRRTLEMLLSLPSTDIYSARIRCGRYRADDITLHFSAPEDDGPEKGVIDLTGSGIRLGTVNGGMLIVHAGITRTRNRDFRISGNIRAEKGIVETETEFDLPVVLPGTPAQGTIRGRAALNETAFLRDYVRLPEELNELWNVWGRASAEFEAENLPLDRTTANISLTLFRSGSSTIANTDVLDASLRSGTCTLEPALLATPYGELELGGSFCCAGTGTPKRLKAVLTTGIGDVLKYLPETLSDMNPQGSAELRAELGGSVKKPEVSLTGRISLCSLEFPTPLPRLESFNAEAALMGREIVISSFTGSLGHRTFAGSGRFGLDPPHSLSGNLKGGNLLVLNAADDSMRMRCDADLRITGTAGSMKLEGNLGIPMFQYYGEFVDADVQESGKAVEDLGSIIAGLGIDLPAAPKGGILIPGFPPAENLRLDISVESRGDIRLQNSVFGARLKGKGNIRGTGAGLGVSGNFIAASGEVRLFPGLFLPVEEFTVSIPEKTGIEPSINFESTLAIANVRVFIQVTGPMSSPRLQLSSDPPYPYEDLASLIIYGHIPGQSSEAGMQAFILQAGQLFGGVLVDRMPRVRPEETFFSRFVLGFESGDPRFEAEEILQNTAGTGGIYAEYMISEKMSLVTEEDRSGSTAGYLEYTYRWPEADTETRKHTKEHSDTHKKSVSAPAPLFRGNDAYSRRQLKEVIRPDRPHGVSPSWDAAAVSDAQFRLRRFYREKGYFYSTVSSELSREGRPVFTIHEGPFVKMGKSSFKGNRRISDEDLRKTLFTDRPSLKITPFSTRLLDAQTRSLQEYYREMGFLDAVVSADSPEYDEDTKRMNVMYRIKEKDRFLLEAVEWKNAPEQDMKHLIALVQKHIGRPLGSSLPETVASNVRTFYKKRGRPAASASAVLVLNRDRNTGIISINVNPGPRVFIENIQTEGSRRVRTGFIEKIFGLDQGGLMKSSRISSAERNLADTDLFSEIWTKPLGLDRLLDSGQDGYDDELRIPLLLTVKEIEPHELKIRLGYSGYEKLIGGVQVGTRNAFGRGESLSAGISAGYRGYRIDGDARFYPAAGYPLKAGAHVFYEDRDETNYTLRHAGISPLFDISISRRQEISAGLLFEWIETNDVILGIPQEDLSSFRIGAPFIAYTKDRRNSNLIPKKGYRFTTRVEMADSSVYGDISFWRASGGYQKYFPVGPNVTFAGSVRGGIISPFGETSHIPLALRFFAGGVSSVRGFGDRELGPEAGGKAVGGRVFGSFQGELRFRMYEDLHGAFFYDAGNVYARTEDIDAGDVRSGAGFGLRYYTPAGAIRFDTAWNTDPLPGEESVMYYFTVGMHF